MNRQTGFKVIILIRSQITICLYFTNWPSKNDILINLSNKHARLYVEGVIWPKQRTSRKIGSDNSYIMIEPFTLIDNNKQGQFYSKKA
jgi:hypothetical protein